MPPRSSIAWLLVAALGGCTDEADPRPQLLLVIDTDAPVPSQLLDGGLASDAAIDTLRVDVLVDGNSDQRELFAAPDASDWPLSLGIATPEGREGEQVTLRLRAFRASLAEQEVLAGSEPIATPLAALAIDRVVTLNLPSEGVESLRVTLALDCWGQPPRFTDPPSVCVSGEQPDGPADAGIIAEDGAASRVGSSPLARSVACQGAPPHPNALCVPGGFMLLGDRTIEGVENTDIADASPLRPVVLSPFWLERSELPLVEAQALLQDLPPQLQPMSTFSACNYADETGPDDRRPINCISWETARALCMARGGDLPSEAQWEMAASGREGRKFPWGDQQPSPCSAAFDDLTLSDSGSYLPQQCDGIGDQTRDGQVDMAGLLSEWTLDGFESYADASGCWGYRGVARDPVCPLDNRAVLRGGNITSKDALALRSSFRRRAAASQFEPIDSGARCAFADGAAP